MQREGTGHVWSMQRQGKGIPSLIICSYKRNRRPKLNSLLYLYMPRFSFVLQNTHVETKCQNQIP